MLRAGPGLVGMEREVMYKDQSETQKPWEMIG